MIPAVFHAAIYNPLYNGLIFLIDVVPLHDVGVAVVLLTVVVRIMLLPLSRRAIETQLAMKRIAPEIEKLKEQYKNNREEQGKAMFALYRERGVHPFASVGLLLVQLPILFALYWIFTSGGLPEIRPQLLYPFIPTPAGLTMEFLGILNMAGHNIVLGVLAAASQFAYTRLSMGPRENKPAAGGSLSADFARSMDLQGRYLFPAMFLGLWYVIPNAAMLYIVTSNIFMIGQELFAGRRF